MILLHKKCTLNLNYFFYVQKEKLVELEKNVAPSSSTCPKEVLENKGNNGEVGNISFPLEIDDKETNGRVEMIFCPSKIEDKENNLEVGNVFCLTETKGNENNFEAKFFFLVLQVGNNVCSDERHIKDI